MKNTVLSLKKEGSMRKMLILCVITIFLVFCSVNIFAEVQKTKVDPDKFKKLTSEQKATFKKNAEKTRDTYLEAAKTHNEVAGKAEKIKKTLETVKKVGEAAQKALKQKEKN